MSTSADPIPFFLDVICEESLMLFDNSQFIMYLKTVKGVLIAALLSHLGTLFLQHMQELVQ